MGRFDDDINNLPWHERDKQFEQNKRDRQREDEENYRKLSKEMEELSKRNEEIFNYTNDYTDYKDGYDYEREGLKFWVFLILVTAISLYVYEIPSIAKILRLIGRLVLFIPILNDLFEYPNCLSQYWLHKYELASMPLVFIFNSVILKLLIKKIWRRK